MAKCKCKLQSGKACTYNAKEGSVYCGRHQNCKTVKQCPSGKEMNAKTGKCVKICAANKTRNEKGRCVNTTKKMNKQKKMYPFCLKFDVDIYDNDESNTPEKININSFSKEAKDLFRDAIERTFVKDVDNFIGITIKDIDITFTNDSYIIMNGMIPIKIDEETKYAVSFRDTVDTIDQKSIYQYKFANKDYVPFKGKEYHFHSVNFCN